MKYAFAAVAIITGAVATESWGPPAPQYGPPPPPETTCTEEAWKTTSAPSAPEYTKPSEQTWAPSSSWTESSSSSWVKSSSAPVWSTSESSSVWAPESSSWSAESSSSAVWTTSASSSVWAPEYTSSTWVETSAAPTPTSYKPVGTSPGPKNSGVAGPSGTGTGAYSAPTPTGSPIAPYKGAANAVNAAGFLAGVGAIAALFL